MLPVRICANASRQAGCRSALVARPSSQLILASTNSFLKLASCDQKRTRSTTTSSATSSTHREVVFSGIQPTGVPHLGNYLGALKQWVDIQNTASPDTTLLYCIVDLHAITQPQDPDDLRRRRKDTMAMLLAIGLKPERCVIFEQSRVPAHAELMWILNTLTPTNLLARQAQWKSKLAASEERSPLDPDGSSKLKLGLFSYPVLQAADILLYKTTVVPVGEDQVQHLELAGDLAGKFNRTFGNILRVPKIQLAPAKRVMSLNNPASKMSKSGPAKSQINLDQSEKEIRQIIKVALTDSITGISYDREARPGVSNLVEILGHMTNRSDFEAIAAECEGLSMKQFKDRVADSIEEGLKGIRSEYGRIKQEGDGYLEEISRQGAEMANEMANETLEWDKKASKLHEKKLAQKDSRAVVEEKEKTLARAAAREGSRINQATSATSAAPSEAAKWPAPGGVQGETTTTATPTAAEGEAREATSHSGSESGSEEGKETSRYSRRKKIASNAWRYEEPEPEPGEEPEEEEPEPDYVEITRDKFKEIEEKEQEREEIVDIWDPDVSARRGRSDLDFGPKGTVVKVNREDFKDVTEKIAKQATADRFRQRFATHKPSARSKDESISFNDYEDELDALIGNMDIKGKQLGQSPETAHSSNGTASTGPTAFSSTKKGAGVQHLDDNWLDDMLR
ncbi:hypothetical protein H072_4887 [Dactylellina haptotyla CBS 200.50]|uniref:tryptophan--tRNA ligase n=1 Tax=Dactylellina haptotyla (strain CBS 200.50) TaxID=1284197 RepID=S8BNZ0_DACHA|nr:hypothetical protein H072_4887 [Dactylellina haptotyla CBS 200.50]